MKVVRRLALAARRLTLGVLAVGACSDVAAAHQIGATRFDAPIPLPLLFLGAGATVAVTAAWLGRGEGTVPQGTRQLATVTPGTAHAVRVGGRILFALVVAFAVYRGLVGRQVTAENVATLVVWPLWLKGLGLVAVVAGSPWPVLSPWRGSHALLERLERGRVRLASYPSALGAWPAVAGFVIVVGTVENLTVVPRSPRDTAGLVALYATLMVLGGLAFGRTWFRRADFLDVLYAQFARVAPLHVTDEDGTHVLSLRYPWRDCTDPITTPGLVAFVVAMVYTVSFDGFTNTPEYQRLLYDARDALGTADATGVLLYLVGLLGFLASYHAVASLVERFGRDSPHTGDDTPSAACAFAPTIIPIAAAYEVAHNYPYVAENLGRLLELALTHTGGHAQIALLGWLSLPAFWASQVLLIVLGHVVAVVAAHQVAVARYHNLDRARRAHLPLVALMVGYTVLSLWIISRPVVAG